MSKILITGGNGFIGKDIVKKCQERGYEYISCVGGVEDEYPNAYRFNLLDIDNIRNIFKKFMPSVVIHLAAIAAPVHSNSAEIYNVNTCGTENLFKAAEEVLPAGTKIILISTAGVYGNQDINFLHEDCPYNPVNHYSCSKMITEIWSRQYEELFEITIVRPFNIIGKGQQAKFFIPKVVNHFKSRTQLIKLGNMQSVRDYVSLDFCSDVLLKLAINKSDNPKVLNICSGVGHTCEDVVNILKEITGFNPQIEICSDFVRKNELHRLVGDTSRLSNFMGYDVSCDYLRDILIEMIK